MTVGEVVRIEVQAHDIPPAWGRQGRRMAVTEVVAVRFGRFSQWSKDRGAVGVDVSQRCHGTFPTGGARTRSLGAHALTVPPSGVVRATARREGSTIRCAGSQKGGATDAGGEPQMRG